MRQLLFIFFVTISVSAYSQATFIIVRHAEKEANTETMTGNAKDPALSTEGKARAEQLAKVLEKQKIDAILSTNTTRTKSTIQPVAQAKGISVQTYESLKAPELTELLSKHKGGTVLICAHSNTAPGIANVLLGGNQFANYDDSDYGNILIVTVSEIGKGTVTHLRY